MLGGSFADAEHLRAALGDWIELAPMGRRLTEILDRISDELVNLDQRLNVAIGDPDWRYSDIAERGPYNTDLMVDVCRAIAFLEIVEAGGEHTFIVDDPRFLSSLIDIAKTAVCDVEVIQDKLGPLADLVAAVRAHVTAIAVRLRGGWDLLSRLRKVRALRRVHPIRLDAVRAADAIVLIWGQLGTFPQTGPLRKTEQLGQLPDFLRANGQRVAFLVHPISWLGTFDEITARAVKADEAILLLEDCLSPLDILRAIFARRAPVISTKLVLADHDLTAILRRELDHEKTKWRAVQAGLYTRIAPHLAELGARLETFVYGFENQSLEKGVIDGFRAILPNVRLIAVQNALFASNYLCFYPSRAEITHRLVPDLLVTTGDHARLMFADYGFPKERMAPAALRYDLTALRGMARPNDNPPRRPSVLCATSIGYDETLELLVKTARALRERDDIDLVVNFHPVTDAAFRGSLRRDLKVLVGTMRCGLRFSESGIRDLLPLADILVYNSSGASFEALAAGIPVVFVGRDSAIDFDKVPAGMSTRCWTANELEGVLADLLARPAHKRLPAGLNDALTRWFAPADPSSVAGWIEFHKNLA